MRAASRARPRCRRAHNTSSLSPLPYCSFPIFAPYILHVLSFFSVPCTFVLYSCIPVSVFVYIPFAVCPWRHVFFLFSSHFCLTIFSAFDSAPFVGRGKSRVATERIYSASPSHFFCLLSFVFCNVRSVYGVCVGGCALCRNMYTTRTSAETMRNNKDCVLRRRKRPRLPSPRS